MKKIKLIRILHTIFVSYFFLVTPLALLGILAQYPMINFWTFITALITLFILIVDECPLTKLESRLLGKDVKVFTIRLAKWVGLKISRKFVSVIWAFIFGSIIISYLVY